MAAAVRLSQSARSWWTISMPWRRASSGRCSTISRPFIRIVPALGRKFPAIILTSVDLPAPLSPISPTTSPASSANDTSLTAWIAPKCFEIPSSSRTAIDRLPPGRGPWLLRRPASPHCGLLAAHRRPSIRLRLILKGISARIALTDRPCNISFRAGDTGRRCAGGLRCGRKRIDEDRERAGRHGRARARRGRGDGAGQEAAGDRGEGARQPLLRGDQPGLPEVELGERRQRVRVLLHRPRLDLGRGRRGADHPGHAVEAVDRRDRHLAVERAAARPDGEVVRHRRCR